MIIVVLPTAPELGQITRVSATEILVNWNEPSRGLEENDFIMYHLRYRPLVRVQRRNTDDSPTVIQTNKTSHLITGLDPRFPYAVSVAASNSAGLGNFSTEVIVGCK